jgi:hypothetical protein
MASLIRKPRSKFWFACFRDANGRQRRKSTKTSDRKKAIKIAEQYEQVGQRKMPARAVRETLADTESMKLPNALLAVVEREKVVDYLLNRAHRYGASKAEFFSQYGFVLEKWELLAQALLVTRPKA